MEEFPLTPMSLLKPESLTLAPALYELRHLRRALSRLEETHATSSPVIADLKSNLERRIRELDVQLGQIPLPSDQQ
jgi:hypothetical protein